MLYQSYSRRGSSEVDTAILDSFGTRLSGSDFVAEWVVVVTWADAVPYYWRYNLREVSAFLVYEEVWLKWPYQLLQPYVASQPLHRESEAANRIFISGEHCMKLLEQ